MACMPEAINIENIRTEVVRRADDMCKTRDEGDYVVVESRHYLQGQILAQYQPSVHIRSEDCSPDSGNERKEKHAASCLQSQLLEVLATHHIKLASVDSITTDNGANPVKSIKILVEEWEARPDSEKDGDIKVVINQ